MSVSCTVSEILSLIYRNSKRSRDPEYPIWGVICHAYGVAYMCKSGICVTKPATHLKRDSYSQRYCRVSIEARVRPIDWWKIWRPSVNFGLPFRGATFFVTDIPHTFCRSATKFDRVVWPIVTYSPNFVNLGPGSPWYHTATCISPSLILMWFFDNFRMIAESCSVVSIRCVARWLGAPCKLYVQMIRIARWFPATARLSCFTSMYAIAIEWLEWLTTQSRSYAIFSYAVSVQTEAGDVTVFCSLLFVSEFLYWLSYRIVFIRRKLRHSIHKCNKTPQGKTTRQMCT